MADDVFLKFQYDERDIVNAMRLRLEGRLRNASAVLVPAIAVSAGAAVVVPTWGWYIGGGVLAAALATVGGAAAWMAPPRMFRADRPSKPAAPASPFEPEGFRDAGMSVDASEDGVAVTIGKQLTNVRWDECTRLQVDRRMYVLHFGEKGYVAIPRRAFRNERRDAAFHELVVECMAAARGAGVEDEDDEDEDEEDVEAEGEAGGATREAPSEGATAGGAASADDPPPKATPVESGPEVGRNDPCPCGSGKKYKKCHLGTEGPA